MKRAFLTVLVLLAGCLLRAQNNKDVIDLDEEFFHLPDTVTNEYLDNTAIPRSVRINDYWIVGVHGGVSVQHGDFNPTREVDYYINKPVYGFSVTRFATMMNTFPIVGMEVGFQHNFEGYRFKEYETDGIKYRAQVEGAYEAYMEVPEAFLLTHMHLDMGQYVKAIAKVGMYGGYRMNITRIGPYVRESIVNDFLETDNRWSYGLQGGLGLGLMLDPFEFHLGVQIKWGWSSFYKPDVASQYYYRFAYPLDGAVTFGLYYQLTPRRGHTRAQLRKMARNMVQAESQSVE